MPCQALHSATVPAMTAVLAVGTLHIVRAEERFPEQIDRIIEAACQRDGTKLACPSDDAEFVRRVYLEPNRIGSGSPSRARRLS